jgi:hypothetical protein
MRLHTRTQRRTRAHTQARAQVLAEAPTVLMLYNNLANALRALGRAADARKTYRRGAKARLAAAGPSRGCPLGHSRSSYLHTADADAYSIHTGLTHAVGAISSRAAQVWEKGAEAAELDANAAGVIMFNLGTTYAEEHRRGPAGARRHRARARAR